MLDYLRNHNLGVWFAWQTGNDEDDKGKEVNDERNPLLYPKGKAESTHQHEENWSWKVDQEKNACVITIQ